MQLKATRSSTAGTASAGQGGRGGQGGGRGRAGPAGECCQARRLAGRVQGRTCSQNQAVRIVAAVPNSTAEALARRPTA